MNSGDEVLVKELNEVLFSLDEKKIRAFMRMWDIPEPKDENLFLGSVYAKIYKSKDAPKEVKAKSEAWLKEHGWLK